MPRGRKPQLKIGDAVSLLNDVDKKGVVVHVFQDERNLAVKQKKPYCVFFHPTGKGIFSKDELVKTKPKTPVIKSEEETEID